MPKQVINGVVFVDDEQYFRAKAIVEELRIIFEADEMVQKWLENPEIGRPYSELRKRWVEEGILPK